MNENFKRKTIDLNYNQLTNYLIDITTDLYNLKFNKKLIQKVSQSYKLNITDSKRIAGLCDYKKKIISISRCSNNLQSDNIDITKEIKNTLMHEFLHAMYPNSGHTKNWKRAACIINQSCFSCKYGTIERCYTIDKKTSALINQAKKYKYKAVCVSNECNGYYNFERKSHHMDLNNKTTNYICPVCGGKMKLEIL